MSISGIDNLLAQMRVAMSAAQGNTDSSGVSPPTDFAAVLKSSLDSVAQSQNHAESLQNAFVSGDDTVNLSQVMVDTQKANIAFQTTVQMRNKVITAYNDIMNMQV